MERMPSVILLCLAALCTFAHGVDQQVNPPVANAQAANVPPPAKPAENAPANKENIMSFDACKEDIHRLCNKEGVDLKSDISILECLQDAGQSESATLTRQCEDLVWQFKIKLTQDDRFTTAAKDYCKEEMARIPAMGRCALLTQPGYALSCLLDFVQNVTASSQCHAFLGMALECLISQVVKRSKENADPLSLLDAACRHEVMRLVEMQTEDFHLDRPLFFACRHAREVYCKDIPAGQGKVFECLMSKRFDQFMEPECGNLLAERAYWMGRDYRMAHPLVKGCEKEMKDYKCEPQSQYEAAAHFHLAWILLCLENGAHLAKNTNPPSPQCQHEMLAHRQMMLTEFRMAPELVMHCSQEIDKWCSPRGDIEAEGRTLHCLMEHASSADKNLQLGPQCMQAVKEVVKVADIGSNYKVDKVLYASCRTLIDGVCARDASSEEATLTCLMRHVDSPDMNPVCEKRLLEVQYFMARDWTLDPQLYEACHDEAVRRRVLQCHATDNWHMMQDNANRPDPGPAVLACLYRSAYDEQEPQFANEDIDHGDVMECLANNKDKPEMTSKCRSYVNHFELVSLRDYHFSYKFQKACSADIDKYCHDHGNDKSEIIRCLSEVRFEHKVLGSNSDLSEPCKKQLKVAYLQQEQVEFDDKQHIADVDPKFTEKCSREIHQFECDKAESFEDQVECLRINFDGLGAHAGSSERHPLAAWATTCLQDRGGNIITKAIVEAEFDPQLDLPLYRACQETIKRHCSSTIIQKSGGFDTVLECLKADFYKGAISDKDCSKELARRVEETMVDIHLDPSLHEACSIDVQRLCPDVVPGHSRVIICLMEAAESSNAQMTADCRNKLMDRNKLWVKAHADYQMQYPESWHEVYNMVANHPRKHSLLGWLAVIVFIILLIGCFCGRATKKAYRELKNR
ncbi:cysteine rich repeat-containing domain protein [Ancylostoma caninum]|uniref:Cysteine rich repeat-containing domain protein n=2 Tax=Ancylostoma TaxID=29169 RepID=A0A368FZG6_ANCCA|nr:cysteine rich repeat-containing domain protein [Ancylostoma caninum]